MSARTHRSGDTPLRQLPSVDEVLRGEVCARLIERAPRWAVVRAVREAIAQARARIRGDRAAAPALDEAALGQRVDVLLRPSFRRVLNATGVVLHTNLGRAPLAPSALGRVHEVAAGYANLEYSLEDRRRGSRHDHVQDLLVALCGAESAVVVNNNAAAVLLALAALAEGREVVVSRGELVEIGGSFRVPDVMRASGARLVEVGTTNKTHASDYRDAITPETALLLKVHRSNFAVLGFTAEVSVSDLAGIGKETGVPVMVDLGSGSFVDVASMGMPAEPTVPEVVRQAPDVTMFSGDKLLGGPQAGIIVGREEMCRRIRRHPLMRALRPDKMTLAALEATLRIYRDGALSDIPVMRMLSAPTEDLRKRAEALCERARAAAPGLSLAVVEVTSQVGGGALPLAEPRSFAVAVVDERRSADEIERELRAADPPVVARIDEGRVLLDVRCLEENDLLDVSRALGRLERA